MHEEGAARALGGLSLSYSEGWVADQGAAVLQRSRAWKMAV